VSARRAKGGARAQIAYFIRADLKKRMAERAKAEEKSQLSVLEDALEAHLSGEGDARRGATKRTSV
jgi:hypothetical protein